MASAQPRHACHSPRLGAVCASDVSTPVTFPSTILLIIAYRTIAPYRFSTAAVLTTAALPSRLPPPPLPRVPAVTASSRKIGTMSEQTTYK
ncbi:unnamed protein product [Alternaria burnsii]|nr:unnamed protein product [Alternaria burnsii]